MAVDRSRCLSDGTVKSHDTSSHPGQREIIEDELKGSKFKIDDGTTRGAVKTKNPKASLTSLIPLNGHSPIIQAQDMQVPNYWPEDSRRFYFMTSESAAVSTVHEDHEDFMHRVKRHMPVYPGANTDPCFIFTVKLVSVNGDVDPNY